MHSSPTKVEGSLVGICQRARVPQYPRPGKRNMELNEAAADFCKVAAKSKGQRPRTKTVTLQDFEKSSKRGWCRGLAPLPRP